MITYIATNTKNGKFYIGSTTNFTKRQRCHLTSKANYPFQNALRKDPEAFSWEFWEDDSTEPTLEQALLDMFYETGQCYNLSSDAKAFGPEISVRRGKDHPLYGKPSTNAGKTWWVNEKDQETMSFECPGDGWKPGRCISHAQKTSKSLKGRYKGEKHSMSKVSDFQREEIRARGVTGFGGNVRQLAEEYGLSGRQIRSIINKESRISKFQGP